jgi:hypothetical protein
LGRQVLFAALDWLGFVGAAPAPEDPPADSAGAVGVEHHIHRHPDDSPVEPRISLGVFVLTRSTPKRRTRASR